MMDIKKVKFVMQIRQVEKTSEDCSLIYNLSNDPLVRINSFNSEPIIYENHVKWFNKVINDSNILFFLVFEDDDFVGQLRFVRTCEESRECVISLSITPEYRGKHIGRDFMDLGINEMRKSWKKIEMVKAEVKCENEASNKFFTKDGFDLASSVDIYYKKVGGYNCRVVFIPLSKTYRQVA